MLGTHKSFVANKYAENHFKICFIILKNVRKLRHFRIRLFLYATDALMVLPPGEMSLAHIGSYFGEEVMKYHKNNR